MHHVLALMGNLGVYSPDALLFARALGDPKPLFQFAIEAPLDAPTVGRHNGFLEPKINTRAARCSASLGLYLHDYVEVPAPAAVLVEAAGAHLIVTKAIAVPQAEAVAGKHNLSRAVQQGARLDPRLNPEASRAFGERPVFVKTDLNGLRGNFEGSCGITITHPAFVPASAFYEIGKCLKNRQTSVPPSVSPVLC